MKLAAGRIIMPYNIGKVVYGVAITFPNGTNIRALKRLLIKEYQQQTGRKLSSNEIRRSGVFKNMEAWNGAEDKTGGSLAGQDETSVATGVALSAVQEEFTDIPEECIVPRSRS